jgi:PAS domain S-box-containing protein
MGVNGVEAGPSRLHEGGDVESAPLPRPGLGSRAAPWLVFVPSALVVVAAVVLHGLGVVSGRESAGVLTAFNSLFCTAPGLLVAFLSARAYLASPRRTFLLLGTGGLVFGLLYLVAGPLITVPNQAITVHNSGLLLCAALFTASGVCAFHEESLKRRGILPPPGRLAPSYVIAALFVGLLTVLAVGGLTSPFYVVGEGPTILRQAVLGLATAGLVAAAFLFTVTARRSRSLFAWLVAAALCAVGVGVGVLVVSAAAPGTPTAWIGRASQWVGGLYLLAGVFTLDRPLGERALLLQGALRASEERFRAVVEGSPLGIFIQTGGRYAYVDPQACRMLGAARPEKLLGMPVLDRIAPECGEAARERIRLLNEERRTAPAMEQTHLTLDGRPIAVEVSAVPFTYAGQNGALVFMSDISERKRAEEALRRSEEQLRQSQKMEAVGQLAGGVAHDFNNLLTAIIGYSDLILAREAGGDLSVAEDVEEIKRAAERAAELTRQILAFSRRQPLRPERISLNDLLSRMEPLLRRALGEDIEVSCLCYADLGLVEVDVVQFEQVLMNLAVNARDAMPEGGRLTLETANVELDESYCLSHLEATPGKYVMLSVSDNGVGMEAEVLPHIFEPFFTTKPPGKGTGLGLSTVYGIVRQSGGLINVYSEPGQGTSFKIYLPRLEVEVEERSAPLVAALQPGGGERVLVVEDEGSLRDLISRVLGGLGYQVKVAASGPEALALAAEMEGPDLLLTDVILPGGMQGNQLAEEMRARRPGLRVLYMSGYTRNAIVHAGRLDTGVDFLEKPFTPDRLAAAVREALGRM